MDASGRGEAVRLQYTGQQLGSSLAVALIGAIVLAGPTGAFVSKIQSDPRISTEISTQVGVAAQSGLDFVNSDQIAAAAQQAGLDQATTTALVDDPSQDRWQATPVAGIRSQWLASFMNLPRNIPGAGLSLEFPISLGVYDGASHTRSPAGVGASNAIN